MSETILQHPAISFLGNEAVNYKEVKKELQRIMKDKLLPYAHYNCEENKIVLYSYGKMDIDSFIRILIHELHHWILYYAEGKRATIMLDNIESIDALIFDEWYDFDFEVRLSRRQR